MLLTALVLMLACSAHSTGAENCQPNPCLNGGTCDQNTEDGGFTCRCLSPFVGDTCQLKCGPIDIALILDTSGSVWLSNWNDYVIPFCKNLIGKLTIGSDKARIGVTAYSTSSHFLWALDTYNDDQALMSGLDAIDYNGLTGSTNTPDGLKSAQEQIFDDDGNRAGVPDIAIVLNDGYCNINCTLLQQYTDDLKNFGEGVTVYVVGIGASTNRAQLALIASDPDTEFLVEPTSFAEMDMFIDNIVFGTCKHSIQCGQPDRTGDGQSIDLAAGDEVTIGYVIFWVENLVEALNAADVDSSVIISEYFSRTAIVQTRDGKSTDVATEIIEWLGSFGTSNDIWIVFSKIRAFGRNGQFAVLADVKLYDYTNVGCNPNGDPITIYTLTAFVSVFRRTSLRVTEWSEMPGPYSGYGEE